MLHCARFSIFDLLFLYGRAMQDAFNRWVIESMPPLKEWGASVQSAGNPTNIMAYNPRTFASYVSPFVLLGGVALFIEAVFTVVHQISLWKDM